MFLVGAAVVETTKYQFENIFVVLAKGKYFPKYFDCLFFILNAENKNEGENFKYFLHMRLRYRVGKKKVRGTYLQKYILGKRSGF